MALSRSRPNRGDEVRKRDERNLTEMLQRREKKYLAVRCPTCGAAVNNLCRIRKGEPEVSHIGRMELVANPRSASGVQSVRATPTAFETNRRRH
jgi:hypothetical protein